MIPASVFLDEMENITEADFKRFSSIRIAACGTSWHAGLAGKYMIEQLARIAVDVDYASEFRYRDPVLDAGHPADRDFAVRRNRRHHRGPARGERARRQVLSICNVQGSMIVREADGTILTHAGPEIGVASTKAFTAQMIALLSARTVSRASCAATLSAEESSTPRATTCRVAGKTRAPAERSQTQSKSCRRSSSARRIFFTWAAASTFRSPSKAL